MEPVQIRSLDAVVHQARPLHVGRDAEFRGATFQTFTLRKAKRSAEHEARAARLGAEIARSAGTRSAARGTVVESYVPRISVSRNGEL